MLILGDRREHEILTLGLPENVLRLTAGEHVHDMLDDDCRQLKMAIELPDRCPSGKDVVPLWESHSYITGFVPSEPPQFIKFAQEDPEECRELGSTINSVIGDLLIWYWTEEDAEDGDLMDVANLLEYPHLADLLAQIEVANEEEHEPQSVWAQRFIATHT